MNKTEGPSRTTVVLVSTIGVVLGVVVAVATSDVILGVIAGSSFVAITVGFLRLWFGGGGATHARHL